MIARPLASSFRRRYRFQGLPCDRDAIRKWRYELSPRKLASAAGKKKSGHLKAGTKIARHPVHLGLGANATIEPRLTGSRDSFPDYAAGRPDDGKAARLGSIRAFTELWDMREMPPHGSDFVFCITGSIRLHQEIPDGSTASTALEAGRYAINEPGTWNTADVDGEATTLFMVAGHGTKLHFR